MPEVVNDQKYYTFLTLCTPRFYSTILDVECERLILQIQINHHCHHCTNIKCQIYYFIA